MTNLPFWTMFTADIVGAARATEDPHNICLPEPLAPIMKFPTRVKQSRKQTNKSSISAFLTVFL